MQECSKSIVRRMSNPLFLRRYFVGNGIDIGGKPDPLGKYTEFFPLINSIRTWDMEEGDAQFMQGVEDETYDFVVSSHCLEHLVDTHEGIKNWFRIIKPGGFLIVVVPDEDLYEEKLPVSNYHNWSLTIYKHETWSDKSINVIDLLIELGPRAEIEKIELLRATYRDSLRGTDQTHTPVAEPSIEFIVRKSILAG